VIFDQTDLVTMWTLAERTDSAGETQAFVGQKDWKGGLDLLLALMSFLVQAVRLSQKGFVAQVGREHQKMWISQLKRRDSAEPGLYAQKDSDGHRSARTGSLLVLYVG
jgi:hypothetical protein